MQVVAKAIGHGFMMFYMHSSSKYVPRYGSGRFPLRFGHLPTIQAVNVDV